ncbi:hypothetical protein GCM10009623_05120 [Nocardioides aestuarii]|uniref:DUF4333 domain-containing protein n=1 Tax=Nocardioides aestuarii TaxID=252231 RepID=A0ABW4TI54_9ACTN
MTQPPPPAGYPGGPTSTQYRPKPRWWVIGGALLVLAPVVFVASLFTVLAPLFREDAVLAADGQPHQVSVAAGEERALFTPQGSSATCSMTDGGGADLRLQRVTGEFTVNEWLAVARFDTGDGDLTVTCDGGGMTGEVRIGQLPSGDTFVVGLLVGILVPIALGGAGLVVLIVTAVLTAGRPARPAA